MPPRVADEMMWSVDANVDAARKLPDWREFHRLCGSGSGKNLCFDRPVKEGRGYICLAFRTAPTDHGGWMSVPLATGRGKTVLDAVIDAYRQSGIEVDGVEVLIGRRFGGAAVVAVSADSGDDFDCLLVPAGDDFEELLK